MFGKKKREQFLKKWAFDRGSDSYHDKRGTRHHPDMEDALRRAKEIYKEVTGKEW